MRPLLLVLILLSLSAAAQHRKAPPTEFSEEPVNEPYNQLVKAGLRSYWHIEFISGYGEKLDTSHLYTFRFNEQGRLLESRDYEYASGRDQEKPEPPFDRIRTAIKEASQISYEYDAAGNVTSMKTYRILLAGSGDALTMALIKKYGDDNAYDTKEESEKTDVNSKEALKHFADSFLRANTEDELLPDKEYFYTYDRDGNILTQTEPKEHKYTRYTYQYDKNGRVTVKRSAYRFTGDGGNMPYYSGQEVHYTYTPDGKSASVRIYIAERDTGNIARDQYLVHHQSTHYNSNGDADTILYLRGGIAVKHIIAYQGHLRTSYTILGGRSPRGKDDTTSFATYRYKDTNLVEAVTVFYADGKRAGHRREVTDYNGRNLLVEHTTYQEDGAVYDPSTEVEQKLFFYGNAAEDKQTALRRRREEAVVKERRQEKARKDREEWEQSKAARKQESPTTIDPGLKQVDVQQDPNDPVFRFVEQMPHFDGDLFAFINANLHYPEAAKKGGIEGRVGVQFVVRRDGSVTDVTVTRGAGHGFDSEAVKMVRRMPVWIPGRQQGRAVSVYFTLPVTFRLEQKADTAAGRHAISANRKEKQVSMPAMKTVPPPPAIPQKVNTIYYATKVKAIEGRWAFSDTRGEKALSDGVERASRIVYDVYPNPSDYFYYTGVKPYTLFEGLVNTWYPNGNRQSAINYHNGIQDGRYQRWYYYGNKEVTGTFRNGIAIGNWVFYYPNGKVMMTATYDTTALPKTPGPGSQGGNHKLGKAQILNIAVRSGFRNPLLWLGYRNNPVGAVHVFNEGGDSAASLSFANGRREGSWRQWERRKRKIEVIYHNDTVIAFYDRHGHNLALDDKLRNSADIESAFYSDNSIDSSGAEPIFPAGYAAYDTNFRRTVFPGGDSALKAFVSNNLRFPKENLKVRKEGNVAIQFVVHSNGTLSNIHVVGGLGYGCDEEALRLMSIMPSWIPAIHNGRNVAMYNTIIVPFKFKNDDH